MIELYTFIIMLVAIGCAWSSYKIGRKEGAEAALPGGPARGGEGR